MVLNWAINSKGTRKRMYSRSFKNKYSMLRMMYQLANIKTSVSPSSRKRRKSSKLTSMSNWKLITIKSQSQEGVIDILTLIEVFTLETK
jgi:hypothetical protein